MGGTDHEENFNGLAPHSAIPLFSLCLNNKSTNQNFCRFHFWTFVFIVPFLDSWKRNNESSKIHQTKQRLKKEVQLMLSVAIVYLMIGHTDYIIKKLNGRRNEISISIFRIMRNIGWLMLVASIFNFFYESIFWNLAYLALAFLALRVIRISHKITEIGEGAGINR